MGQKINPMSNRLPLTKSWQSSWFAERDYATRLLEDMKIREIVEKRYGRQAGIGRIEIKRTVGGQVHILIHTAKPGMIIGRAGAGIAELRKKVEDLLGLKEEKKTKTPAKMRPGQTEGSRLKIDIIEIKTPELWARLVADNIAGQIERRVMYRRAIRQSMERVMTAGAKGVKFHVAGRLGGAEIARSEKVTEGSVPLSTFRADIDYAQSQAVTTYGTIGIKVWIHRGDLDLSPTDDE